MPTKMKRALRAPIVESVSGQFSRARHVGAPGVWGCHGRLAVLGPYRGPPQPQPTMTLNLKPSPSPPASPFTWDLSPPSPPTHDLERPPSPPTSWLSARDMKTFGAEPLVQEVGIVKCKDCQKAVLRSSILEHAGMS